MSSYQQQYPAAGQMPQAPPQGQYPQYQQQYPQQQYPQQAPQQPQAPMAGDMPQWHEANDEATRQAFATAAQNSNFGPQPQFLKIPGPRGQQTWDHTVLQGFSASCVLRFLPPWADRKPVFVESKTIFYKSHKYPRGRVLGYQGDDSLYMQAIQRAANSGDARLQQVATDYGRVRTQYLYNVADLTHPDSHTGEDGVMRPYILSVGRQLQGDIGKLVEARGGINRIVNPVSGRPIRYTKTKTGPEPMNVAYGVIDLEPAELHPYFRPILSNLWDLEAQIPNPTQDDVLEAMRELGLPDPRQTMGQVPQGYQMSYQPDPNPPHPSPYQAQGQMAPPQAPAAPVGAAPAPVAPVPYGAQQQPPAAAQAPMQYFQQPDPTYAPVQYQQPAPAPGPSAGYGVPPAEAAMPLAGQPPPQPGMQPPPPPMPQTAMGPAAPPVPQTQPPPVSSGTAMPGVYQPTPGGMPNPL